VLPICIIPLVVHAFVVHAFLQRKKMNLGLLKKYGNNDCPDVGLALIFTIIDSTTLSVCLPKTLPHYSKASKRKFCLAVQISYFCKYSATII